MTTPPPDDVDPCRAGHHSADPYRADHHRAGPQRRDPQRMSGLAWGVAAGTLVVGLAVGTGVGAAGTFVATRVLAGTTVGSAGTGGTGGEDFAPLAADVLDEELPPIREFVAAERGLDWVRDVPVRMLADEEFEAALTAPGPVGAATVDDPDGGRSETYAALHLTPSSHHYRAAWGSGDGGVVGFYDDETEEVVLRGTTWDPLVETTLVHELTHALDDQHVDLGAGDARAQGPEALTAWRAVVEGDATRVEWAYEAEQDPAWSDDDDAALDGSWGASTGPPDSLVDALSFFPYDDAASAVDDLAQEGGGAAVDAAFASPPTTTEQVLSLREWAQDPADAELADAADVPAPAAPRGAVVLGTGTLGVELLSMLEQAEDAEDEGYWVQDPVEGWAGDAWTTWADPEDAATVCTDVLVRLDDAGARDDLAADLEDWAGWAGAGVEPDGRADLRLMACGDRD